MTTAPRTYAWKQDVPDSRDHKFTINAPTLPQYVGPLGTLDIVEDQGNIGSCTGHAATTALEISLNSPVQYSRLMAYYNARLYENSVVEDSGAYIRDVIKGFRKFGVANEVDCPYITSNVIKKPLIEAYIAAKDLSKFVGSYERLSTLADIKNALALSLPVIFGFNVPDYFVGSAVSTSGWCRVPTANDPIIGGHAVCAIGYDDRASEPFVWVRNSWGSNWGINGNFKMPYGWFTSDQEYVSDMWVIHPAS